MIRRLIAIALVATSLTGGGAPILAQQPPPPDGNVGDCNSIGGPVRLSGEEARMTDPIESLVVPLKPPGEYRVEPSGFPGSAIMNICHIQTNASVAISAVTGLEVSRVAHDDAGHAVLDQLVENAVTGPGEPSPVPVTPPNTGSAGLAGH